MKLGTREIICLVVMAAVLGCAYLLLNQITTRRQELLADSARKRQVLLSVNEATRGIEDLNQKIEELKRAITFFESKLPEEKEVNAILDQVSRMADVNSLQSKSVKTLRSTRAAGYSEQPIEISLSGDFYGFYAFLLQLENLPRITRITKMDLERIDDHDGEMQAKVTLSIFFEPQTGTHTAATAANPAGAVATTR